METAIEVKGLTRKFGNLVAVDHVEFGVYQGEIFGFLGPNGAGKTTIVRMLTGVIHPTEGTATISANVSDSKSNNERSFEVMDANWHN
jgi:ABC-2 type transport system ATP-binding protein